MTAVDFSFARFSAAQLKAAGVTAVGRYLTGAGKAISPTEFVGLLFAGLDVFLAMEIGADDASGGFAAGVTNAEAANAALVAIGAAVSQPVYFAADEEYADPSNAEAYYQGIASVRPAATNGCYGEGALIDFLFGAGLVAFGWESDSESFPGNATASSNANLWQRPGGGPLPSTDLDLILKADFGQCPRPKIPPPPPPGPPVNYPEDNMRSVEVSVPIGGGSGWVYIPDGMTASQITGCVPIDLDPAVYATYTPIPRFAGVTSDNKLVFSGIDTPDGNFGFYVWAVG